MGLGRFLPPPAREFLIGRALKMGPLLRKLNVKTIRRHGVSIDTQSSMISDQCVAGLFWGIYEWGERKAIKRFLLRDSAVIEVGASVGFITNLAARLTPGMPQIAVEPNSRLLPLLKANIERNGNTDKVHVVWGAIDYSGKSEVVLDVGTHYNLSGFVAAEDSVAQSVISVPAFTLRKLLAEHSISSYTLISDIEGAEIGLLNEDPATMASCRQIIIELHPSTDSENRPLTPGEVGERISERWSMPIIHRDHDVWVLQRT